MNKNVYLKIPWKGHLDLTVPVKIVNEAVTHIGKEYIVYSSITDTTFPLKEEDIKLTPVDSEYVVDVKTNKEKFLDLVTEEDTSILEEVAERTMRRKRLYIATAAMQGLLANSYTAKQITNQTGGVEAEKANRLIVRTSFAIADEMLKQK